MSHAPDPRTLRISDYTYDLPDGRIAHHPLPLRDQSKLLVYRDRDIDETTFSQLPGLIPEGSTLVLNNAKVVRARMNFQKPSGGKIEIFCLEPDPRYGDITKAMAQTGSVYWQCLVGGAAKWKPGTTLDLQIDDLFLQASLADRAEGYFSIHFQWAPAKWSFAEVLQTAGRVPLPPYIRRQADHNDESRYQSMFAAQEGSVAAPTASLHFTPEVLESLEAKSVRLARLTLHVGAGTFMPVKSDTAGGHSMHREEIEIDQELIQQVISGLGKPIIAAGTTALRCLESLYWLGMKVHNHPKIDFHSLEVKQWEPYESRNGLPAREALEALSDWMRGQNLDRLVTRTGIMIAPGYRFQLADALITNFHQPQSTLLLLVAAFVGDDWRKIYDFALHNDFRFLSYGDGSLLWRSASASGYGG
jgi:S-adenosylmethionine:tRNA ribosyltransferase-isomerase